jgi:hypothetical protein
MMGADHLAGCKAALPGAHMWLILHVRHVRKHLKDARSAVAAAPLLGVAVGEAHRWSCSRDVWSRLQPFVGNLCRLCNSLWQALVPGLIHQHFFGTHSAQLVWSGRSATPSSAVALSEQPLLRALAHGLVVLDRASSMIAASMPPKMLCKTTAGVA